MAKPRCSRALAWLAGALVLATVPIASADLPFETPDAIPLLSPDYGLEWTRTVLVTDDEVQPQRVEIRAGEKVAWRSDAPRALRVSFDAEVARAMRCTELVNFALEGGRLRSGELRQGDIATLCELAPGTYRYRIDHDETSARRSPLSERLRGEIVVLERPPLAAAD